MGYEEMRGHRRNPVTTDVTVNDGRRHHGGKLTDMSIGGALVVYPNDNEPTSDQITVGQLLHLTIQGASVMPGRVARIFEGGFATEFDFSLSPEQY